MKEGSRNSLTLSLTVKSVDDITIRLSKDRAHVTLSFNDLPVSIFTKVDVLMELTRLAAEKQS
jgi:hypothetical protein